MSKLPAILIIRLSSLGDCLLLGPLFRGTRNKFPQHQIVWMTKPPYHSIWEGSPWIDAVVQYSKNNDEWKKIENDYSFDYIYDLQASLKSKWIAKYFQAKSKKVVKPPRIRRWFTIQSKWNFLRTNLSVPLRYLSIANDDGVKDDGNGLMLPIHSNPIESFPTNTETPIIALAYGSKHLTKCWPWKNYKELSMQLLKREMRVLWVLGPDELDKLPEIELLASQFPNQLFTTSSNWHFHDLFSAISRCTAIVTNDSAAMHIAAGTQVPGIAFFGPTIQEFGFAPFRSKLNVLERNLSCRPCSAHGTESCPLGHHQCLSDITIEEVWEQLQMILTR